MSKYIEMLGECQRQYDSISSIRTAKDIPSNIIPTSGRISLLQLCIFPFKLPCKIHSSQDGYAVLSHLDKPQYHRPPERQYKDFSILSLSIYIYNDNQSCWRQLLASYILVRIHNLQHKDHSTHNNDLKCKVDIRKYKHPASPT